MVLIDRCRHLDQHQVVQRRYLAMERGLVATHRRPSVCGRLRASRAPALGRLYPRPVYRHLVTLLSGGRHAAQRRGRAAAGQVKPSFTRPPVGWSAAE
ncbi:protein of unknown function [Cupriavidus taiwanensis]|nr:protein of unknown function [Cupriavidus taiwanensis]SPC18432.1 hypothetical protein CT19431_MP30357 [Cupriavidus taiwanensis]